MSAEKQEKTNRLILAHSRYVFLHRVCGCNEPANLVGGRFPVSEAKVIFLQQVDVVAHLRQELLAFCMFLNRKDTHVKE